MSAATSVPVLPATFTLPAAVNAAITEYRNAVIRATGGDALATARAALEHAISIAIDDARLAGEGRRRELDAELAARASTTDLELLAWLDETAASADQMVESPRERVAQGDTRFADDVAYWERERRCSMALAERLRAAAALAAMEASHAH